MAPIVGARPPRRRGGEWQSGRAEAAFGRHAPDIPMGAAAAGAVIDLVLMVDDAIAAVPRVVGQRLDAALQGEARHGPSLRMACPDRAIPPSQVLVIPRKSIVPG